MPPQGLLLIAAYMPAQWPVRFIDENIRRRARRISPGRMSSWSAACTSRRRRFTISPPRQGRRQGDRARRPVGVERARNVSGFRLSPHRRNRRQYRPAHCLPRRRVARRRPRRCASKPRSGCRSPIFRSRPITSSVAALPDVHAAILQRLSLSLRVLRHPEPLWPAAAVQDAGADHRRARRHVRAGRPSAERVFRRRQFHRQPQGRARNAAASRRVAEGARLSDAICLRGDAQYRQAARNSVADARGLVSTEYSSASRRRRPTRSRPCARARTIRCR
jgi:hypothetical protein